MRVGQIIYNVYNENTNSYFSTKNDGISIIYSNNLNNETYKQQRINIIKHSNDDSINLVNIISNISGNRGIKKFYRLGVQAPLKTKFVADNRIIMIGQTGLYELSPNINIDTLYFLPPEKGSDLFNIIIDFAYILEGEEAEEL